MRIKFKKPDPRDGQIVEMDEGRAKQLIEQGSATKVGSDEAPAETKAVTVPQNKAITAAPANKAAAKKATSKRTR